MLLSAPVSAFAQAYLGEPNTVSANFGYTYAPSGKLIATTGDDDNPGINELPNVIVHAHIFELGGQYMTPIRGLAVEASLPLVAIKVGDGSFNHFPKASRYDDHDTHFTFTDLRGGLRYQLKQIEQYLGLSFSLAGSVPVADYPTLGFGGPGHQLKALYAGVSAARTLDPVLPNLYVQLDYEYAKREKVDVDAETEKFNRDYSSVGMMLAYFLPHNLFAGIAGNYRHAHGGTTFNELIFESQSVQDEHDRLLKESFALVGGNLGWSVNEKLQVGAAVRFFVYGRNTRNQNLFGVNANYSF